MSEIISVTYVQFSMKFHEDRSYETRNNLILSCKLVNIYSQHGSQVCTILHTSLVLRPCVVCDLFDHRVYPIISTRATSIAPRSSGFARIRYAMLSDFIKRIVQHSVRRRSEKENDERGARTFRICERAKAGRGRDLQEVYRVLYILSSNILTWVLRAIPR